MDGEDPASGRAVMGGEGGDDGIGFVGKRIGGISPAQARVNAVARKSKTIENMAEVHHETGDQGGHGCGAAGDHGNGQELHRAGVDDDRENRRPPPTEAGLDHEQAEA